MTTDDRCGRCGHTREEHTIPPQEGLPACVPDEHYVSDGVGGYEDVWEPCDCPGFTTDAKETAGG